VWYDFYTGEKFAGQTLSAPLERIPLFVRGGSILITGDVVQSTATVQKDLAVTVYAGADAAFTLYEDDGVTYAHEKGAFTTITFTYWEANKTLRIGALVGDFPGKITDRKFAVKFVTQEKAVAFEKEIEYKGVETAVEFAPKSTATLVIVIVVVAVVVVAIAIVVVAVVYRRKRRAPAPDAPYEVVAT
jgi:alpha-D-xyloside xylohydrolase